MWRGSNLNDKQQNFIKTTAFQKNHKYLPPYVVYPEVSSYNWI